MNEFSGKMLIFFGILLIILGLFFVLGAKIPYLGKLPGDIVVKKDNIILYFPIITSIILSIILTIILNILREK